jgi:hypothetical protein
MNATLLTKRRAACKWADKLIPKLPFIVAVSVGGRRQCRQWQKQASKKTVTIPTEPGIYLIYPSTDDTPVYIGEASDLCRRLTYHFADSASSHKESTLKKNLRRDKLWDGNRSIESSFRFRYFTVSFGRTEIEEHLHKTYQVNTGKC